MEVTLSSDSAEGEPYFRRQFDPTVTREVRLFLDGGDDAAVVSGQRGGGPLLRILGGEGRDSLVDSTGGGGERFYDDPDGPARVQGSGAGVDRRPYVAPRKSPKALPPRDWGSRWTASTQVQLRTGYRTLRWWRADPLDLRLPEESLLDSAPLPGGFRFRTQDLSGGLPGTVPAGEFFQLRRGSASRVRGGRDQLPRVRQRDRRTR